MADAKPAKKAAAAKKAAPAKKAVPAKTTVFTSVEEFTQVHEAIMDLPQEPIAKVIELHPEGMVVVPLDDNGPRASAPPSNTDPKLGMARLLRLRRQRS